MLFLGLEEIFSTSQPGIPRMLTALAEWSACAVVVLLMHWRLPKVQTLLLLAAGLPIQIMLRCFGSYTPSPYLHFFFYVGMVVNVAFMLLLISGLTKEPAPVVLFWWAAAFLLAEFSASLGWQICCFATLEHSMLSLSGALLSLAPVAVCDILACRLFRGKVDAVSNCTWGTVWLVLVMAFLTFQASNTYVLHRTVWSTDSPPAFLTTISLIRLLAYSTGTVLFWLILKSLREKQLERDMATINGIVNLQYQQYLDFRERSAYIAQQCHDLKHQVAALRKNCTPEEQERYLAELEESVNRYGFFCNTGSPVLDTILTQKMLACRQLDIQLGYTADAKGLEALAPRDICILFGNLLDNAVEYVQSISEKERRQILVTVEPRNRFLYITVENCCDRQLTRQGGLPETTKEDRSNHGYGGKSIAYTVEKYDGTIQVQSEGGWFTASILLPVNPA